MLRFVVTPHMPGKSKPHHFLGISTENDLLPISVVEEVLGVVIGYNPEGDLVGQSNLGELSQERRAHLGFKLLEMGQKLLEGRIRVH